VSAKLCGVEQKAPPTFGRAAITLGIGPLSSFSHILDVLFSYVVMVIWHAEIRLASHYYSGLQASSLPFYYTRVGYLVFV